MKAKSKFTNKKTELKSPVLYVHEGNLIILLPQIYLSNL